MSSMVSLLTNKEVKKKKKKKKEHVEINVLVHVAGVVNLVCIVHLVL